MQLPCCGYNRVKSVNMVFIEPQSKSQGPAGRALTSLGLRDPCQVPWRDGCAGPWRAVAFPWGVVQGQWMASPALNICYEKSLGVKAQDSKPPL